MGKPLTYALYCFSRIEIVAVLKFAIQNKLIPFDFYLEINDGKKSQVLKKILIKHLFRVKRYKAVVVFTVKDLGKYEKIATSNIIVLPLNQKI